MTEKNIFAYKLCLSLNISDFSLFFMWKLQPPEKSHTLFPSNPPLKAEVLSSLEERGGGGAHYVSGKASFLTFLFLLYGCDFPDDVVSNIDIHVEDTTLYSKCDWVSGSWQQLKVAFELESDLQGALIWHRK